MTNQGSTNRDYWLSEEKKLHDLVLKAAETGGDKAVQKLAKAGKRPVRQLIQEMIDENSLFFELSRIAGFGMGMISTCFFKSSRIFRLFTKSRQVFIMSGKIFGF